MISSAICQSIGKPFHGLVLHEVRIIFSWLRYLFDYSIGKEFVKVKYRQRNRCSLSLNDCCFCDDLKTNFYFQIFQPKYSIRKEHFHNRLFRCLQRKSNKLKNYIVDSVRSACSLVGILLNICIKQVKQKHPLALSNMSG